MNILKKKRINNKYNLLLKEDQINKVIQVKKTEKIFDIFSISCIIKILFCIFIILLFLNILLFVIFKRKYKSEKINIFIPFNITNNNTNKNNDIIINNTNNNIKTIDDIINNNNKTNDIINKNISIEFEYFACFCGIASQENKYAKEFIEFYINLGVEKFFVGDNNLPNTEKLSDILQDYIKNGTVEIFEMFGSILGQSEFGQSIYEKYKTRCGWFLFFDFDEYLEIFFKKNEKLNLKQFLPNQIFSKCESILFNWLIYTDNELIYYDNRTLVERFTTPNYADRDNKFVKSIVRGNLNKIVFQFNASNHVPSKNLSICDSNGNLKDPKRYSAFFVNPPVFDYGYLKHFTTKTAEEYSIKMKRGRPRGRKYVLSERVKLFFYHNKFSKEKLKVFENMFNMTFKIH